jgi:hypothetical protein
MSFKGSPRSALQTYVQIHSSVRYMTLNNHSQRPHSCSETYVGRTGAVPCPAGDADGVCVIHAKRAIVAHLAVRASPVKEGGVQALSFHRSSTTLAQAECSLPASERVHGEISFCVAKPSLLSLTQPMQTIVLQAMALS